MSLYEHTQRQGQCQEGTSVRSFVEAEVSFLVVNTCSSVSLPCWLARLSLWLCRRMQDLHTCPSCPSRVSAAGRVTGRRQQSQNPRSCPTRSWRAVQGQPKYRGWGAAPPYATVLLGVHDPPGRVEGCAFLQGVPATWRKKAQAQTSDRLRCSWSCVANRRVSSHKKTSCLTQGRSSPPVLRGGQ